MNQTYRPKLIEVALPLAAINREAARDKGIGRHPQSLHRWWARRPLGAARAVIWASLVDDPSGDISLSEEEQDKERQRLFGILERLVLWENSNDARVLAEARAEIDRCYDGDPPAILDPFGGGGAIPLEAHRLGLTALSGDLNPVSVLIQRAMIEIPPRFAGRPPVHPDIRTEANSWQRAQGLAADVEAYGRWMRDQAWGRIGHHYPDAVGRHGEKLTPIAWIWARTVESPDPSWNGHVPLVASWMLANKPGKPRVWIEPNIDRTTQTITYEIREGGEPELGRTVDRGNGTCIATGAAMPYDYVRAESLAGRMGQHLMAIVAEGPRGRTYLPGGRATEAADGVSEPAWKPVGRPSHHPRNISTPSFGLDEWWKHFTPRQLVALTTFSDLLSEVKEKVEADAVRRGNELDGVRLRDGGDGATAYADAVVTYLAFAIDKTLDFNCSIASWDSTNLKIRNVFARQAIPMTWDFAECNVLGDRVGCFVSQCEGVARAIEQLPASNASDSRVEQRDARALVDASRNSVISTDPPYYDNISYADLSDFFFVWLRRNVSDIWPGECATLTTPKTDELIANRYRAGSKAAAELHFESGMADFMKKVALSQNPSAPATIYYAYKATETKEGQVRSTGWDTFLQAVLDAGFEVTATWPLRTEKPGRSVSIGTSALASSIVIACRPRHVTASLASTGEFLSALRNELPDAVRLLQTGNIAPVDMAQSTIGPGVKIFSRYAKVVEADGSSMSVSDALLHVNSVLGEILDGEDADLDRDTRFAVAWFTLHGYNPGPAGDADSQARSKGTTVGGVVDSGIAYSQSGRVRLVERGDLATGWSPVSDDRLTVWEATQYLIAALDRSETEAAALLHQLGGYGDRARSLAYVLFKKCTDKGWTDEAAAYNGLITAWPSLLDIGAPPDDGQQRFL